MVLGKNNREKEIPETVHKNANRDSRAIWEREKVYTDREMRVYFASEH